MEGEASRRHVGGIRKASGKHLGSIWEASGKHLGVIWEASGKHLGGIQEASGGYLRLQEAMGAPGGSESKKSVSLSAKMQKLHLSFNLTKRF